MQGMLWLIISYFWICSLAYCGSHLSLTIVDLQIQMTLKYFNHFLLLKKVFIENF